MVKKSETSKRLEQLAAIDEKSLCNQFVAELFGISRDAVYFRFKRRGLNYHNRENIAEVLREFEPVIDEWYDTEAAAQRMGIDAVVVRYWTNKDNMRKEMGVRNVGMHLYYNPSRVEETARKLQRAGGYDNLVTTRETAEMLGIKPSRMTSFELHYIQFIGKRSRCYFRRDHVVGLKKRIERLGGWENLVSTREAAEILGISRNRITKARLCGIQFAGKRKKRYFRLDHVLEFKKCIEKIESLHTTREVAHLLNWSDKNVLRTVKPTTHHPLSNKPRYHPNVIWKHRNKLYSEATSFNEILDYCQDNIHQDPKLRKTVKHLVYDKYIPQAGKDKGGFIYLSKGSEKMVESIYTNHKLMAARKTTLLTIEEAASQTPISEKQLRHLVDYYGAAEALSSGKFPSTTLHFSGDGGRLQVPFVVYTPKSHAYFLTSDVVDSLDNRIRALQTELAKEGRTLNDTPWRMQLAKVRCA